MLFNAQTELLNASISAIQNEIEDLEKRLIQLRESKAEFEAEKQMILTLESAAESALTQCQNFLNAAESLQRQDLIETFWNALDNLETERSTLAQLPEGTDPDTDQPDVSPTEPTPESDTSTPTEPDRTEQPEQLTQKAVQPHLTSVGSSGFNPTAADLDALKRWVRSHQSDTDTRSLGKLTSRKTWELAAKQIIGRIAVEQ